MRKLLLSLITSFSFLLSSAITTTQSTGDPSGHTTVKPYLLEQLAKATTPADSVRILYDLFDCSPRSEQTRYGELLLTAASRAHDYSAKNDMLRQLAIICADDEARMHRYMSIAETMPNSVDKHVTSLFITHQLLANQVQSMSEDERKERLIALLTKNNSGVDGDIYDKVERLYSIAIITGHATQGQLYLESLERLTKLVEQLPAEASPLRNQFYTALANIYTNTDRYDKALEADRKLLQVIDQLEKRDINAGRKYRSYAVNRYLCYRRMLGNYRAMTRDQVRDIYQKIQELAAMNPDVAAYEQRFFRTRVYYNMAMGNYEAAIPLIREMLSQPDLKLNYRRQALRELRLAAEKTGNDAVLLDALKQYTAIIDKYDSLRTSDNLTELAVRYQVSDLRNDNTRLLAEARDADLRHGRQLRIYYTVVICVLALLLLLFYLRLRRYRRAHRNPIIK